MLIVPLSSHADFKPFVRQLSNRLQDIGISSRVDDSGASIGKRYSVRQPRLQPFINKLKLILGVAKRRARYTLGYHHRREYFKSGLCVTQADVAQFQSVKDNTFTLRDRDSTEQVRAGLDEICKAISSLVNGTEQWSDVAARLPKFEGQEVD